MTLRRLWALVRYLPPESAVARISLPGPHWSLEAHLLDEVNRTLRAIAGEKQPKVHPERQKVLSMKNTTPMTAKRVRKLADARRRARERRRKAQQQEGGA